MNTLLLTLPFVSHQTHDVGTLKAGERCVVYQGAHGPTGNRYCWVPGTPKVLSLNTGHTKTK